MRLIDADRLTEMMCESCDTEACCGMGRDSTAKCYSVRQIEEQPTAFDIEEVVEELEEMKTKTFVSGITFNPYEFGACRGIDRAIEIVRKGGVK